ncbi:MAG: hypothetical protein NVSMB65_06140 [Chloroflexota bacterium]
MLPGEYLLAEEPIAINVARARREIVVTQTGDRPIQVGSHFHFFEVNRALRFDRAAAYGYRLDVPSGASVRFEPGEQRPVTLVPLGGDRVVWGFNGLVSGALDAEGARAAALVQAARRGFGSGDAAERGEGDAPEPR